MTRQELRIVAEKRTHKERFAEINRWVSANGGWLISVAGDPTVTLECLPGSCLSNALADMGYDLRPEPDGERILPHAVATQMTVNADGTLGILAAPSTQAVSTVITRAGIRRTQRFTFSLP
jgi:hypothetical protein